MNKVKLYLVGLFNALLGNYPHEEMKELARLRREKLDREYPELAVIREQALGTLLKPPMFMGFRDRKLKSEVAVPNVREVEILDDCLYSGLQRQFYDNFQRADRDELK